MRSRNLILTSVVAATLCISATGCSTTKTISLRKDTGDSALYTSVKPGDRLTVTRHDQSVVELTVISATQDKIVGESLHAPSAPVAIDASEISTIRSTSFSATKTVGAALATGTVVAIVFTVIMSAGLATALIAAL